MYIFNKHLPLLKGYNIKITAHIETSYSWAHIETSYSCNSGYFFLKCHYKYLVQHIFIEYITKNYLT